MVEIRKIKKDEHESAQDLIIAIMKNEFAEDIDAYPLKDLDDITASYGNLGEAFFVCTEVSGDIVGTVGIKREDERTALMRRIFVHPNYRRRQVGSMLMDRAIEFCREVGYQEIVMKTTSKMKGAIKLCLNKQFVERAKIDMGTIELFKFALFIKENSPLAE